MVSDEHMGLNGRPEDGIDSKLKKFYESQITEYEARLIQECMQLCEGDFDQLHKMYEGKQKATNDPRYVRDMVRIEKLKRYQEVFAKRDYKSVEGQTVNLGYLVEKFEPERANFSRHGHETKVIDVFLGTREIA